MPTFRDEAPSGARSPAISSAGSTRRRPSSILPAIAERSSTSSRRASASPSTFATSAAICDPGIRFVQSRRLALLDHVAPASVDVVFMSNYLEHLASADEVVAQLKVVTQILKPGGRVIVLQPNIRLRAARTGISSITRRR